MNEAELVSNIIAPYLKDLGFSLEQIKLEQTFSIQLGRNSFEVNGKKTQTGRLDCLVTDPDNRNLFVIEAKSPENSIDKELPNQGISYARLLKDIAPFVILTNGKKSKIFDTISYEELSQNSFFKESNYWANNRTLSTDDDLHIRHRALCSFLGYSSENISIFCQKQLEIALLPIKGNEKYGKYIPEIYTRRIALDDDVNKFITSERTTYLISGESSCGKTNSMSAIAEQLSDNNLVLFFNAYELYENIEHSLQHEFGWNFSENKHAPQILSSINDICQSQNVRAVLFIDGLDEATTPSIELVLSKFVENIKQFNGAVKLICSIKTSAQARFLSINGNPSRLKLELDKNPDSGISKTYVIERFNKDELNLATAKYQKYFNTKIPEYSGISDIIPHPFMMRVVCELASSDISIIGKPGEREIIKYWLNLKLGSAKSSNQSIITLATLAGLMVKSGRRTTETIKTDFEIDEILLFQNMPQGISPDIIDKLYDIGLVVKGRNEHGKSTLTFYYGGVLDYFAAYHCLNLEDPDNWLRDYDENEVFENEILRNALGFAYNKLPKKIITQIETLAEKRAIRYLAEYERLIDNCFTGLRPYLPPYGPEDIGLGYRFNEHLCVEQFLYPITEENHSKTHRLRYSMFDDSLRSEYYREMGKLNGQASTSFGEDFLNRPPEQCARKNIFGYVQDTVKKCAIEEGASISLVQEALFAILLKYDGRYGIRLIKDRENRIDINAIKWSFKRSLGVDCYNFEWQLKNAIGNSLPQVIKSVSDDNKRRVEAELKAGIDFNPPNIQGKSDLQELPQLFDNYLLSSRYISLIDNTFLELAIGDFHPHEPSNLSVEKISDYMTRLFKTGFIEYQQLVECNFPGIKENLYWYKRLPIETILDLGTTDNESGCVNLRIGYIFNSRQGFKVSISPQTESQIFSFDNGLSANLNGSHVDIDHLTGSTVESFMFSYGSIGVNSGSRWSRNKMPIRSFVYELLLEDFRELEESPINEMLS